MACAPYKWRPGDEEAKARLLGALRSSRTRSEAASKAGITTGSLDHGCEVYGIARGRELGTELRNVGTSAQVPSERNEDTPGVEFAARVAPPSTVEATPQTPPLDWTGARPKVTGSGLERRLVFTDLHIPFHNLRACAGVIALARTIQPHAIDCLGDLWNMGAVSHHPRPFGGPENHRSAQVQGVAFLDAVSRAAPGSRRRYYVGNHCSWADEFEDSHPEYAGLMSAKWLGLDRIGWEIIPRHMQPLVCGPVDFAHGTGGGEMYAKRYALHADTSAHVHIRGHHHSMQHHRAKNGHECWGAGWLGRPECSAFDYAKEKGHWETGCLVVDVLGERVTVTPVRLDGGACLYGGKLIAA